MHPTRYFILGTVIAFIFINIDNTGSYFEQRFSTRTNSGVIAHLILVVLSLNDNISPNKYGKHH